MLAINIGKFKVLVYKGNICKCREIRNVAILVGK